MNQQFSSNIIYHVEIISYERKSGIECRDLYLGSQGIQVRDRFHAYLLLYLVTNMLKYARLSGVTMAPSK